MNPREPTTTAPSTESSDEKECAPVVDLVPQKAETKAIKRRRQLEELMERDARLAEKHIHGLLLPGEAGDRDARDETMRDKAAFEVRRGYMRAKRDETQAIAQLGVIVLKQRLSASDWEKQAQDVDKGITVEPKK